MHVTTLAPPAVEPVGLAEARAYLRIGHDGEDDLVADLVASARGRIEALAGMGMIVRTLRVTLDQWGRGALELRRYRLPVRPAHALIAVQVKTGDGAPEDVTDRFGIEDGPDARLVWLSAAFPWPKLRPAGVVIDYEAGFGEAPADVPESLRLAVLRLAAHAYIARDADRVAGPLPEDVRGLVSPWRRVRL